MLLFCHCQRLLYWRYYFSICLLFFRFFLNTVIITRELFIGDIIFQLLVCFFGIFDNTVIITRDFFIGDIIFQLLFCFFGIFDNTVIITRYFFIGYIIFQFLISFFGTFDNTVIITRDYFIGDIIFQFLISFLEILTTPSSLLETTLLEILFSVSAPTVIFLDDDLAEDVFVFGLFEVTSLIND